MANMHAGYDLEPKGSDAASENVVLERLHDTFASMVLSIL